jgi:hypothetical protein
MKKLLIMAIIFGAFHLATAATTNVYVEDWGTVGAAAGGVPKSQNITLANVGWTEVAPAQPAGPPYIGIYYDSSAADNVTLAALPGRTVYFTLWTAAQTNSPNVPGMFYTTDAAGSGTYGDSSFTDINPTQYTNLTLSVEVYDQNGPNDQGYFAVQVGGSWYVSTNNPLPALALYPLFTNATLVYTNPANVWNNLSIGTTNATVGSVASLSLTSPITGIGIVEFRTTAGFDYNQLAITAYAPNPPPPTAPSITATAVTPQNVYVGGGASFTIQAAGTVPLTYIWETNGVPLSGARYLGLNSSMLTITNCNANDALPTYSVIVTNAAGSATNGGITLDVSTAPAGTLYAETFPYLGPGSSQLPINGAGWAGQGAAGTYGIYQVSDGLGTVSDYSGSATTNALYTDDILDTNQSGLPFLDINPASYAYVTLQANLAPGNGAGQVAGAVTVYWTVQMGGSNWYSSVIPIPVSLAAQNNFLTNQFAFNADETNWNNLTMTNATSVIIGSQASSAITNFGNITGAGLVFVFNATSPDMNLQSFAIVTNQVAVVAPIIGDAGTPNSQTVAAGGGVSFGVAVTGGGTPPFSYYWKTNGVVVFDGGRISGSATATLTIADLNSNDNDTIVAFVTNSAGSDESDNYFPVALTVTNPAIGLIYSEQFPFVGPVVNNYPVSGVGWVETVPFAPNALYQTTPEEGFGAVAASFASAGTNVYFATTTTDTNQSGLPFPNIDLAAYTNLSISVDIAPNSATASNVTAYLAVQLNGTNWYVAASALPVPAVSNSVFTTYTTLFSPVAANWDNLTVITNSGGVIGSPAASNLNGVMTGAGVVFATTGIGGSFNFANFVIMGSGLGGINVGPLTGGNINLSWVGNPVVKLQSSTNLNSSIFWQDVPGTYGLYSEPVTVTGKQAFFRLKSP